MQGSKNMAFDSANLTTPDIKWLGVRPSDLDKFNIPEQCRLEMSQRDIETGQHMLKEEFVQQNPEWAGGRLLFTAIHTPHFFTLDSSASSTSPPITDRTKHVIIHLKSSLKSSEYPRV